MKRTPSRVYVVGVDGDPGRGCERCGFDGETRCGGCFVCAMLEDPESETWEIESAVAALAESGRTVEGWRAARVAHGFPVKLS